MFMFIKKKKNKATLRRSRELNYQRCDVGIQRRDVIEKKLKFLKNKFLRLRALLFLDSTPCPTPTSITRATSLPPLRSRSLRT